MKICFLFTILINSINSQGKSVLSLNKFEDNPEAKCIDGSDYGVYFSKGSGEGEKKIIVNIWAGSWCNQRTRQTIIERCLGRTRNYLGSSSYWKTEETYEGYQYLSGDPVKNKLFHDYNKFDIPYCDSTLNQGYLREPIEIYNYKLYFRGYQNTAQAIRFMTRKLNFADIDTIVVTGCSSAGWATLQWVQYISDIAKAINPNIEVFGLPNGGFFVDYKNNETQDNDLKIKLQALYDIVNQEVSLPLKKCVDDNKDNPVNCMLPEHFIKYINTPILLLQSLYDRWSINEILGERCLSNSSLANCSKKQKDNIEALRTHTREKISSLLSTKKNLSIWSPACIIHCFKDDERNSPNWQVPEDSGNTVDKVVERFLTTRGNEQIVLIDEVEWPNNKKCSNHDPATILKYEIEENQQKNSTKNLKNIEEGFNYLKLNFYLIYFIVLMFCY